MLPNDHYDLQALGALAKANKHPPLGFCSGLIGLGLKTYFAINHQSFLQTEQLKFMIMVMIWVVFII